MREERHLDLEALFRGGYRPGSGRDAGADLDAALLRSLVVEAADMVIVYEVEADASQRVVWVNGAFERLTGARLEEVAQLRVGALFDPADSECLDRALTAATTGSPSDAMELRLGCDGGAPRWVMCRITPIGGRECALGGVIQGCDVTSRVEHTRRLESAKDTLEAIIDFLPDSTFVIDNDHRVIAWNRALEDLTGVGKEEVLGHRNGSYSKAFYGEHRPILIDLLDCPGGAAESKYHYVQRTGDMLFAETFIPHMDRGRGAHLWVKASSLCDKTGRRIGAIETVRDITSMRSAQSALEEREEQLHLAFENAPFGMALRSPEGKYLHVNQTFCDMIGRAREELDDGDPIAFTHPEDRLILNDCLKRMRTEGLQRGTIEKRYVRKSGEIVLASVTISMTTEAEGRPGHFVLQIQDITEARRAQQDLLATRERLRKLAGHMQVNVEEERRAIARDLHDELGQALTMATIDLKWLGLQLPRDRPREWADRLERTHVLLKTSLDSIRRISASLRPRIMDDFGIYAAVEAQLAEFGRRTNVATSLDIEPPDLQLDKERSIALYRLVQEALTNIARHARATKVEVTLEAKKKKIVLTVRDDGIGLDEQDLRRDSSFGVIGMQERVNHFGGKLTIRGRRGKGTLVHVTIPRTGGETNDQDSDRG